VAQFHLNHGSPPPLFPLSYPFFLTDFTLIFMICLVLWRRTVHSFRVSFIRSHEVARSRGRAQSLFRSWLFGNLLSWSHFDPRFSPLFFFPSVSAHLYEILGLERPFTAAIGTVVRAFLTGRKSFNVGGSRNEDKIIIIRSLWFFLLSVFPLGLLSSFSSPYLDPRPDPPDDSTK